jgi:multimeric flavodoxin WrbA
MNIALVNGSPKTGTKSNSGIILNFLKKKLEPDNNIFEYNVGRKALDDDQMAGLCGVDAIVIGFPLYCDAPPSHLQRMMIQTEKYVKNSTARKTDTYLYAIANNGFYEGSQNRVALDIMKNWCDRAGFSYGQGIGQGAGEMLPYIESVPLGHGPLKNLGKALDELVKNIQNKRRGENIFISPNFPYICWEFMATNVFWNGQARKNGLKKKDIVRRPE